MPFNKLPGLEKRTWTFHKGHAYCTKCLIMQKMEAFKKEQDDKFQARLAHAVAEKYLKKPRPVSSLRKLHSGKAWHRSNSFRAPYVESPSVTEKLLRISRADGEGRHDPALDTESLDRPQEGYMGKDEPVEETALLDDLIMEDVGKNKREVEGGEIEEEIIWRSIENDAEGALWGDMVEVESISIDAESTGFEERLSIGQFEAHPELPGLSTFNCFDEDKSCLCRVGSECEGEESSGGANNASMKRVDADRPLGARCDSVDSDGENNLEVDDITESLGSWGSCGSLNDVIDSIQAKKSFGHEGRFSFMLEDEGEDADEHDKEQAVPVSSSLLS